MYGGLAAVLAVYDDVIVIPGYCTCAGQSKRRNHTFTVKPMFVLLPKRRCQKFN